MPTIDDKRAKKLAQVRALLAKANGTNFPEEAQTFREAADRLMVQYAIDEWQVTSDQPIGRPEPEMRLFDFSWWSRSAFRHDLWWLMESTAEHCRCVAVYWDRVPRQMKVVGLPADLDYFDLLFTQLMLEHAKRMNPQPDANGEVGEEVFKLRQAGVDWMRITKMIYDAGLTDLTPAEREKQLRYRPHTIDTALVWDLLTESVRESIKNRLANANRRYVRQHDLGYQRNYTNPRVYQRSFSEGFVSEIVTRMRQMRRRSEDQKPGDNHMAIALRDIRSVVVAWANENYPQPEPQEDDGKKSKAVTREVAFDIGAYHAGSRAGREVHISSNPGRGLGNQKELDR